MLFDTHAHYTNRKFDINRIGFLNGLSERNVGNMITVGTDITANQSLIEIIKEVPYLYGAVGIHPFMGQYPGEEALTWIREHILDEKIVAVGEIGLDFLPIHMETREWQLFFFEEQLKIAKEYNLPIIMHSVEALAETKELLHKVMGETCNGILHRCFYPYEICKTFVDIGFFIGIGGEITYDSFETMRDMVRQMPIEHLVIETDCPGVLPRQIKEGRNDSQNLKYVVEEIAKLKGMEVADVIAITEKNAKSIFKIS